MSFDNADGPPDPKNDGGGRDDQSSAPTHHQPADHQIASNGQLITASRQVAWWPVYDYINRQRRHLGALELSGPLLGTPAWVALPDDHPAKLSAVLNAAEAVAYSVNADQAAAVAASRAISAAADWSAIAKANRDRADFLAANPWARRVVDDGSGTAKLATDADATVENIVENGAENTSENDAENTALATDAENTPLAEGIIDFATANPWARRAAS
jgi:hypothetical protein